MTEIKKKTINEICDLIDLIIAGKDNRIDYKYIYRDLNDALTREINYEEILLICKTILKISKTKNRILRHLEKDFWNFINRLPSYIMLIQGLDVEENEELLPNIDYDNTSKKILSRLVGLVQEVMQLKDDNSKGSEFRRASSLKLIGELVDNYHISFAKQLFKDSLCSKNTNEQYEALQGLENYYGITEGEIEDDLVKILNGIKNKTDDRTVASTCLQIQINAGIIDEMTALSEIDDWKDKHYY